MNDLERQKLKNELRSFTEDSAGIQLSTPFHWAIDGVENPLLFFENISIFLDSNSILYFEGTSTPPGASVFYTQHQAEHPTPVRRDTLYPVPEVFHVKFSAEVIAGLCRLHSKNPNHALFDHVKAYQSESVIFTFHDAFAGCLRITDTVPETTIRKFCDALKVSYARERTENRGTNALQALLHAMEHPDQIRIRGETWWEKSARKWKQFFKRRY